MKAGMLQTMQGYHPNTNGTVNNNRGKHDLIERDKIMQRLTHLRLYEQSRKSIIECPTGERENLLSRETEMSPIS